jgi:pteridine reductase
MREIYPRIPKVMNESRPDSSLDGKVALVTGGARRVGAAIARRLHAAGARVLVHYRDSDADAAKLEAELNAIRAKSASKVRAELLAPVAPRALVSAALESFGRLDVLVNNASAFFPVAVGAIEPSHWEELIGSNLRAPLFIAQQAAPELAKTQGSIVNIVDIHAERPLKGYALYSVAKAGLAALTRALALELAPAVRVNGVAPGAIAWPEDGQFEQGERARILATTPLGRIGSPEDIARAVHFLATAPYVTGQIIAVDGGRSIFI